MIIDTHLQNIDGSYLAILSFLIYKYGTNGTMSISMHEAIQFFHKQPRVFMDDSHEGMTFYRVEFEGEI